MPLEIYTNKILRVRCGNSTERLNIFERIGLFFSKNKQCPAPPPEVPKFPIPQPESPKIPEIDRRRYIPSSRDSSGNGGDSGGNSSLEIGTTDWQRAICPDPNSVISHPGTWNNLFKEELEESICFNDDEMDELEDIIDPLESEESEDPPRRRLLTVKPTPTGQLDAMN